MYVNVCRCMLVYVNVCKCMQIYVKYRIIVIKVFVIYVFTAYI